MISRTFAVFGLLAVFAMPASAQQGYEFEVYGAEIGPKGSTEIELGSNYVADGLTEPDEGLVPTHHASRSSFEFSRTLDSWLQATAYISANVRPGQGLKYVGNRIKLTAVAPASWNLPFDLGVANEVVYALPGFAEYRWAYEITPIIAKGFGPIELVLNPAFERGLSGSEEHHIEMEPRGKIEYELGDEGALALEYYAGLGGIGEGYTVAQQRHQVFAKVEREMSPGMEAAFAVGRGLTRSSDRWVLSVAFEYKIGR